MKPNLNNEDAECLLNLQNAFGQLENAFSSLNNYIHLAQSMGPEVKRFINDDMSEAYPFHMSFDELNEEVFNWGEEMQNRIDELLGVRY